MNPKLKKALLTLGLLSGLAAVSSASDWVWHCYDFKNDKNSPYSTDYGQEIQFNSLFECEMGVSGTVRFDFCLASSATTLPVAGRIGFSVGAIGSTQDDLAGSPIDDNLRLTFGSSDPAGNFTISQLLVGDSAGANIKKSYFGNGGLNNYWFGASDRYFYADQVINNVKVALTVDVLGDCARLQWVFTNQQATQATIGFNFGQWVYPLIDDGTIIGTAHTTDYVMVPGFKPLSTDHRFKLNANPAATQPKEYELPPYVNFGMSQSNAYGLQVVLQPSTAIPDQTPAQGIDIGKTGFLLGSMAASDGAMPDVLLDDTIMNFGGVAYVEKWDPILVGAQGSGSETRTIVAYYKSTWSTSNYAKPYAVTLDAPPVIATQTGSNPAFVNNGRFNLTISIDNTKGFSTVDKSVPLQDVKVTVDLPQGMSDANDQVNKPMHMTQYINTIQPQTIAQATFKVAVDPTLFGAQQYTVTIAPNPGSTKVLTGSIVVASQAQLQFNGTANLVAAPWQFADNTWQTIIGVPNGLAVDKDYQVFGWDAQTQSYVIQTGPQRGFGSFVITNNTHPFFNLGGSPQQVPDMFTGAPQIIVHPGWNLVANPYNYAIPIGQIVGVPESDNQNAYSFSELVNQNVISGFLATWDPVTQGYKFTTSFTDLIQPNAGYWLFVQSNQDVVLSFPPVFQAFVPGAPDLLPSYKDKRPASELYPTWSMNLVARANGVTDAQTAIGQTTTAALSKSLTRFKPPIAPVQNTIWTAVTTQSGNKTYQLGRALTPSVAGTQTWNWQVYTGSQNAVSLTWPAVTSVPNNVKLMLVDMATGVRRDMRQYSTYTFTGRAKSTHNFQVIVTTGASIPVISSVVATPGKTSFTGSYSLSVNANSTVKVMQSGQVIATLINNRTDAAGNQTVTWNYLDAANRSVRNGTYQLVVSSTPSGGAAENKAVSFIVKR